MKLTFLTMAAIATVSVAAPAAAQNWQSSSSQSAALQMEIDEGARSGTIARSDMPALRNSVRQLAALERRFSAGGISRWEAGVLEQRSNALRQQIDGVAQNGGGYGETNGERRAAWEADYDRQHRAAWDARYVSERSALYDREAGRSPGRDSADRFDRPNRGDRFAGDVRVGQRASNRMRALPAEYRIDYQDNQQVYYGYDDQRIYRIDRRSGLILGMLDLPN
jgi:hypothetical protein